MNVLVIEDESRVADLIRRGLESEGWQVELADSGELALGYLRQHRYDVVTLDLMLPGISGQTVCQAMRANQDHTPVLMLSALDATDERIAGLKLGADDYLAKPFDFDELVARIEALARRAKTYSPTDSELQTHEQGLSFDRHAMALIADGQRIDLSAKERELAELFLANRDQVLSRSKILNAVWGTDEDPMTNIVDVYIGRLRRKIGAHGARIKTVRGVGYRFE